MITYRLNTVINREYMNFTRSRLFTESVNYEMVVGIVSESKSVGVGSWGRAVKKD